MIHLLTRWYHRYLSDDESVILLLLIMLGILAIMFAGDILAPVLTSIVLAYLLESPIASLMRRRVPRRFAFVLVYVLFVGALVGVLLFFIPLAWGQLEHLLNEQLPMVITETARILQLLPERYPGLISEQTVADISAQLADRLNTLLQTAVSFSVTSLSGLMDALIFVVLTPLLVFFFLKDKDTMIAWGLGLLPNERPVINRVLREMHDQIGHYVHGKAIEILIVGGATYLVFLAFGLNYAALLGFAVGISVVIPYVGAVVVTLPVALVAYLQFGAGTEFFTLLGIHLLIQGLDGNVLVPLLFSEAVNMHPVAIMVAVLVFGGVWGVWGVFFAIPLATLIKAVISAWPTGAGPSTEDARGAQP